MAAEAGDLLVKHFRRSTEQIISKGRGNVVTEADFAAEQLIIERLREEYPEHAILAEESGAETRIEETPWLWVIDPLDGTRNFASGIPHWATNIALCYGKEPVVGVTFDPLRNERFWAVRGQGAFLNNQPIRVSATATLQDAVMGVDLGYSDARGKMLLSTLHELFPGFASVRLMGSAALGLAYVACGRYDLYVHNLLYPWDIAPGILMIREAGGVITNRDGEPTTIHSESIVGGGTSVSADFLRRTAEMPWKEA